MPSPAAAMPQLMTHSLATHWDELHRLARHLVGHGEADDLLQNTLERALSNLDRFAPGTNLLAWLRRIMSNLTVDSWRFRKRHPQCSLDLAPEFPVADPSDQVWWEELTSADVRGALATLPPKYREVIVLHHDQSLSYLEISQRLGIPMSTVGTRLLRARNKMRKHLTQSLRARGEDDVFERPASARATTWGTALGC